MEKLTIYNYKNFPYKEIRKIKLVDRPRGNNGGYIKGKIKNVVCAFDIETYNIKREQAAIMYAWALNLDGVGLITGRTWEEFKNVLLNIKAELNDEEKIIIYCHKLDFEYQFLSGIYKFQDNEVFATDRRQILKAEMMQSFIFRDSYKQSGVKLEAFLDQWQVKHKKLKYDYNKPRFPHTKLTTEEWKYIYHDVLGLTEAIKKELAFYNDTLITIPATKTGYLRREAKRLLNGFARTALRQQLPDAEIYPLMREAFRGGDCIDNRYRRGEIIRNVANADRSSAYPAEMLQPGFPIGKWQKGNHNNFDAIIGSIYQLERAVLMRVAIRGVKLRKLTDPAPYLMITKCRSICGARIDAGRILKAEYLETTITDIDLEIIVEQYDFADIEPLEWYYSRKGKLPVQLTELIQSLYIEKTALKNKPGAALEYYAAKTKIDSLYGLCVQDPCKRHAQLRGGEWHRDERPMEALLADANNRAFLSYSYGIWTTAAARKSLRRVINSVGDYFLYADTDSVYCDNGALNLAPINKELIKKAQASGGIAFDYKGLKHYAGVWEEEPAIYKFKYLGQKQYATQSRNGKIEITLAGIDKEKGAKELKKRGGLEALEDGFTFYEAGGNEAIYNEYKKPRGIIVQGHKYILRNNVYLQPRKITLGNAGLLETVLSRPDIWDGILESEE